MSNQKKKNNQKQIDVLKNRAKEIKKSNNLFKNSSAGERRVLIAEDILANIKNNRYEVRQNVYVNLPETIVINDYNKDLEVRDYLEETMSSCEVCARGAAFISACNVFNNLTLGELTNGTELYDIGPGDGEFEKYENKFWTKRQLMIMETFFESVNQNGTSYFGNPSSDKEDLEQGAAGLWGRSFEDPKEALIVLMKNIIKNKGEIKIPVEFMTKEKNDRYD